MKFTGKNGGLWCFSHLPLIRRGYGPRIENRGDNMDRISPLRPRIEIRGYNMDRGYASAI